MMGLGTKYNIAVVVRVAMMTIPRYIANIME